MSLDTSASLHQQQPLPILHDFISEEQLLKELRICRKTFCRWRAKGDAPKPTIIGNRHYYHREEVAAWLAKKRENTKARK